MRKQTINNVRFQAVAAVACAALLPAGAFGQQRVWDGGSPTTNNWSDDANWNNTFAGTTGNIWRIGSTSARLDTEMDQAYSLERLEFFTVSGHSVNSAAGNVLSLRGAGNGQTILVGETTVGSPTIAATINVPILLSQRAVTDIPSKVFDVRTGSQLTLNGAITSGTYNISKAGPGTVIFNASSPGMANTYSVANGDTRLGTNTSLGAAVISHTSGNNVRILSNSAAALTLSNDMTLDGTGAVTFTEDTGPNMTLSGPIALVGSVKPFGVANGTTLTLDGAVSGAGGISKQVAGTMVLNANNSYTGNTFIANGTLVVNGTNVSDTLVGAGKLQGDGSVRILSVYDDVDNANPAGVLSPGDDAAAAIFTASRADFADGGTYLFNLNEVATGAGVGWDLLSLTGVGTPNASLDVTAGTGGFRINLTGPGTGFDDGVSQVFKMVDADAVTGFDPSDFVIDTSGFAPAYAGTFSVDDAGGDLNLVYTAIPEPAGLGAICLAAFAMLVPRRRAKVSV